MSERKVNERVNAGVKERVNVRLNEQKIPGFYSISEYKSKRGTEGSYLGEEKVRGRGDPEVKAEWMFTLHLLLLH